MSAIVNRSVLILLLMAVPAFAQNARLQVIHNSGDIDARTVDVYVDDVLTLDDIVYRTATPFMDIPAGAHNIKISPRNQLPADSLVAEVDVTLDAGVSYVGIASGIMNINLGRYSNPENRDLLFTVFAVPNVREAATASNMVDFIVFHGSTDAPAVDVLVGGATPPLVDNLDYGQATSYLSVAPGVYQLDITPATDNATIVGSFEADLSGLGGGSAVVFASGFLTPVNNEGGLALGLFAALPNGDVVTFKSLATGPIGKWKFAGDSEFQFTDFFGADTIVTGGHGITVDKKNRIWVASFNAGGVLRIMNPDGTPADISPITTLDFAGESLTATACRGMSVDNDGNIIYARGSRLYRINADLGTVTDLWTATGSLLAPMVDHDGFIWTGLVVGINPVSVIDPSTFTETQQITLPNPPGFGRGIAVTADGSTVITPDLGESGGPLYIYTTTDFLNYQKTDSIFTNTDGELIMETQRQTLDWNPQDSTLWVSLDLAGVPSDNSKNGLYIFDFKTYEYKILRMPEVAGGIGNGPRGVAFSVTGDTAYATIWNGNRVARFVRKGVSVDEGPIVSLPETYELSQNYPNPFNPSTTISFALPKQGRVELKIYDGLGREVAKLVDKVLPAGRHEATFDARRLASGTYHYRLKFDDKVLTKSMVLLK